MIKGVLPALYSLTIFVSAALLFSVQPMVARMALPMLGGSPAVWTTCMLFFQATLLAGYAYAHASIALLGVRRQSLLHLLLLPASLLVLPIAPPSPHVTSSIGPTWELLGWLTQSAALPVFALATTAPLLQRWFAATGHPSARDPYYLYAASNVGSLTALLAYPFWIERSLGLLEQSLTWTKGLLALAVLVAFCAIVLVRSRAIVGLEPVGPPTRLNDWLGWVVLAFIPSSLLLGLTTYLTTDLAAIPLLWVIPLALFLLSFVVVFSRFGKPGVRAAGWVFPFLVMVQGPVMAAGLVQPSWIPLHLATFLAAAIVCHGELARRRPPALCLTSFYLALAIGGVLGGVFNALLAPSLFDRPAEYPIALVAACLVPAFGQKSNAFGIGDVILPALIGLITAALCSDLGGFADTAPGMLATTAVSGLTVYVAVKHRKHPARFALTLGILLVTTGLAGGIGGRVIERKRSFFGVLKVTEIESGKVHRLFHGSTLHGQQSLDPARRREPSTYFDRTGPVGQLFEAFHSLNGRTNARVAVTGLGVGSLASYARESERWTFYEIDPAVVRMARDPKLFTYLNDCRAASLAVIVGDARLAIAREPDREFDLIILDAFSSDSIPMHLLTREALALDLRKLARGGLIAVNITNRYLDLAPVIALLARDSGLSCLVRVDSESDRSTGKQGSIWAVLSVRLEELGPLALDPRWFTPLPAPGDRVWTDDFSNLLDHFQLGGPGRKVATSHGSSATTPAASRRMP